MVTIAIIDTIGLTYDGSTLTKRGLGGSESAVILMAKSLSEIGFEVTVFNSCQDAAACPGLYDGVMYHDLSTLDYDNDWTFDVVISSRTVVPFLHPALWHEFVDLKPHRFKKIKENAKHRVVWMHDTFCRGDQHLEGMITHGDIHEIFTLSDFQTSYVTNCDHGARRNFEVLKNHVFQTRNGIVLYKDEVDIKAKDPFLCVYNASVTKGMLPLVNNIWPKIKEQCPQAKLKVIGGYYRFREKELPLPDLIKMDVQGAELSILKGAEQTLTNCKDLILELQNVEYNKGAPLKEEVIEYLECIGYKLVSNGPFSNNGPDGDYHFTKV